MDQWKLETVEEQRVRFIREVEIDATQFDKLAVNFKAGTYSIRVDGDRFIIAAPFVDYVLVRKP